MAKGIVFSSGMAKKVARGIEQEIEKARKDARWEDIPKLLRDLDDTKSSSVSGSKSFIYKIYFKFS